MCVSKEGKEGKNKKSLATHVAPDGSLYFGEVMHIPLFDIYIIFILGEQILWFSSCLFRVMCLAISTTTASPPTSQPIPCCHFVLEIARKRINSVLELGKSPPLLPRPHSPPVKLVKGMSASLLQTNTRLTKWYLIKVALVVTLWKQEHMHSPC